ncbi:hypothetical protein SEA_JEGGS_53 [Arthrobacter phage JEGGS]|uniref:Uncharacterized protein n=2 Tax=Mudcatvirus TaxID=1982088 RepID=A0A222Z8L8_9CAUD|nr:hypothetical protein PQB79_gp053 [Arthrobacter phage Heisenberger]YP_010666632.1 hypothetical protein PQB80_gp053 [Arthrobacter phage JEGGS]ASR80307.1 hypothetical protein SEA_HEISENBERGER_53 [Arthrobacter phage Heisenberger]QDM57536.1 hypothetical protein SEA_JEGGS_53 [Arthrobacter phage JEGGS]
MTEIVGTNGTLGLSDSGEYLMSRLDVETLYDRGVRTYSEIFAHLLAQNPGFEFSIEDDFKTAGWKVKWNKIK